jgi:hypothetical protein
MNGAYRLSLRLDQHRIHEVLMDGAGEISDVPLIEGVEESVVGGNVNADRSQEASEELMCSEWTTPDGPCLRGCFERYGLTAARSSATSGGWTNVPSDAECQDGVRGHITRAKPGR